LIFCQFWMRYILAGCVGCFSRCRITGWKVTVRASVIAAISPSRRTTESLGAAVAGANCWSVTFTPALHCHIYLYHFFQVWRQCRQYFVPTNPPVLNWSCRLTQLYNGHKTVAIVVVVFVVVVLAWYHFTPFVCLSVS